MNLIMPKEVVDKFVAECKALRGDPAKWRERLAAFGVPNAHLDNVVNAILTSVASTGGQIAREASLFTAQTLSLLGLVWVEHVAAAPLVLPTVSAAAYKIVNAELNETNGDTVKLATTLRGSLARLRESQPFVAAYVAEWFETIADNPPPPSERPEVVAIVFATAILGMYRLLEVEAESSRPNHGG